MSTHTVFLQNEMSSTQRSIFLNERKADFSMNAPGDLLIKYGIVM